MAPRERKHLEPEADADRSYVRSPYIYVDAREFGVLWPNVLLCTFGHLCYLYALYVGVVHKKYETALYAYGLTFASGIGITAGAHRLWSHRAYEASLFLRIVLMILQSVAGQKSIYLWARDHRVHHKFSETDADPHNIQRGFFFAHVGWLLTQRHPEVEKKISTIDYGDLWKDPVVYFQHKYYPAFYAVFAIFLPVVIPVLLWGENLWHSFLLAYIGRYVTMLHAAFFVNSLAHMVGTRPYNINIQSRDNGFVAFTTFGEGFHNYHHTFPWDYSTSEYGWRMNVSTMFIDLMAALGLAYNRRRPSLEMVENRKQKVTGNGHLKLDPGSTEEETAFEH